MEGASSAVDTVATGLTVKRCINHLKENRIEDAILTLLVYTLGLFDKAVSYGADICV